MSFFVCRKVSIFLVFDWLSPGGQFWGTRKRAQSWSFWMRVVLLSCHAIVWYDLWDSVLRELPVSPGDRSFLMVLLLRLSGSYKVVGGTPPPLCIYSWSITLLLIFAIYSWSMPLRGSLMPSVDAWPSWRDWRGLPLRLKGTFLLGSCEGRRFLGIVCCPGSSVLVANLCINSV